MITIPNSFLLADLSLGLPSVSWSYRRVQVRDNCFLLCCHCNSEHCVSWQSTWTHLWEHLGPAPLCLGASQGTKVYEAFVEWNTEIWYGGTWLLSSPDKSFLASVLWWWFMAKACSLGRLLASYSFSWEHAGGQTASLLSRIIVLWSSCSTEDMVLHLEGLCSYVSVVFFLKSLN